ncbi:MAG TPA: AAA family ATPase [Actinomycetota bacterium]|nr:AAA family ATPase [Actinomycetota bacterium]
MGTPPPLPPVPLTVQVNRSGVDARRGVVRLHPMVLEMLGVKPWEALELKGQRTTGALAAAATPDVGQGAILLDDITCLNAGVKPGDAVQVRRFSELPAASVTLSGLPKGKSGLDPEAVRFAMLGKILSPGDRVSLLPQDFYRPGASLSHIEVEAVILSFNAAWGDEWKTAVLEVASTSPSGLVRVNMETVFNWENAASLSSGTPLGVRPDAPPALHDLPGLEDQIKALKESLELGFHHKDLVERLGATAILGVLVTGPPGSGKVAMVKAVAYAVGATLFHIWGPSLARKTVDDAASELIGVLARAEAATPAVILIEDVDSLAPREEPGALLSVLLEVIAGAAKRGLVSIVCTTAHPEGTSQDLRRPGLLDLEIELPMPRKEIRARILEVHARSLPMAPDVNLGEVAARTPGFVAADLLALCREAALSSAARVAQGGDSSGQLVVTMADFHTALEVVKPSSMEGATIEVADVRLEDVGDMTETKDALNEAIVWPLKYPDSFERLGVDPPRGVLLYGPPGCGKTFLVKAIANSAEANFLSVKGAELLSKWVGESERAVRELFRRARNASPSIVFFDEVDALAPVRGQSSDSGTTDRVVAQLLTELDGVEELRGVFILAATNRPELVDPALMRPGRLERSIYVPPPDAEARSAILTAVTRKMPCAPDFDPAVVGESCEGYSSADLEALARTAAMIAMREDIHAPQITAAHFKQATKEIRPSLRPEQVARLEEWAAKANA